jgi:hypothetical protein
MKVLRIAIVSCFFLSLMVGGLGCEKQKSQTVADKPLFDDAFKAEISIMDPPSSLKADSIVNLKVRVKNVSGTLWPAKGLSDGKYAIQLAYHWIDKDGKMVIFEGRRTPLSHDLRPKEEVIVNTSVHTPNQESTYFLQFDMVQELVAWFKDKGSKTADIPIKVE